MKSKKIRTYSSDPELIKKRRQEISAKTIKLFIKKGYLKTTTREITKACSMSTGALYHYIGTKEDILSLLSDNAFSVLKEISKESFDKPEVMSPTEKLRIAIEKYLQRIDENQDTLLFWYQESKNLNRDAFNKIISVDALSMKIIEEILIEGCQRGEFDVSNTTLMANNIIVLCDNWVYRRWFLRKRISLDEFIKEQTEFIMRAICVSSKEA